MPAGQASQRQTQVASCEEEVPLASGRSSSRKMMAQEVKEEAGKSSATVIYPPGLGSASEEEMGPCDDKFIIIFPWWRGQSNQKRKR